jgi:CHAT domain-containing protein
VGGAEVVFVAPDGNLSGLSFSCLPDVRGKALLHSVSFVYLTCGRDLLDGRESPRAAASLTAIVCASPDFDLEASPSTPPTQSGKRGQPQNAGLSLRFRALPGAREEGVKVAKLLGVEPWLDKEASEARLRSAGPASIIHLATHGFFLPRPPAEAAEKLTLLEFIGAYPLRAHRSIQSQDPLYRSGIALAGANRRDASVGLASDGIMTAAEILDLDLSATELVVLSACETGLGEVEVGEGVAGLRSSFAVAGAETLVMSLWKVSDQATADLMTRFYEGLVLGKTRSAALRDAQLEMASRGATAHAWGGFILQGNPGSLRVKLLRHPPGEQ